MSPPLALREPELAWAARAQAGELQDLSWVDTQDPSGARLSAPPLTPFLPPSVAEEAEQARACGVVSAWEALGLLLACPWWWVNAASHLWSSASPSVEAQIRAVERHGIGLEHHQRSPERLARLIARLPSWVAARGQLEGVRHVGRALDDTGVALLDPAPAPEVLLCRGSDAWSTRSGRVGALRIAQGRVVLTDPTPRRPEELTLRAGEGEDPRLALRLLPVWTTLRPAPASDAPHQPSRSAP